MLGYLANILIASIANYKFNGGMMKSNLFK